MFYSKSALLCLLATATAVSGFTVLPTSRSASSLSMLEDASSYTSTEQKVDIAPPAMAEPAEETSKSNAFFASPEATNEATMDIQMAAASSESVTPTNKRKIAKFQQEADGNGIMMETNKPFPTVHAVQPLVVSQKKAVLDKQGIMMASKPDKAVPKAKTIGNGEPGESSTMLPNNSSFKWRPAKLTEHGKIAWQQREIDFLIAPADE